MVKADDGQVTTSGVVLLPEEQRTTELARMMGGAKLTPEAKEHAEQMLRRASKRDGGGRHGLTERSGVA